MAGDSPPPEDPSDTASNSIQKTPRNLVHVGTQTKNFFPYRDINEEVIILNQTFNGSLNGNFADESRDDANHLMINVYFTPILIFFGIIGNVISIRVFSDRKFRNQSTSQYLTALAVSDTLFLLQLVPPWLHAINATSLFNRTGFCQLFMYMSYVSCCLSAWLVVAFTAERFMVVLYPLQRQVVCSSKRARNIIAVLTGCAFLINIPVLKLVSATATDCSVDYEYFRHASRFNLVDCLVSFTGPLLSTTAMNIGIIAGVIRLERKHAQLFRPELRPAVVRRAAERVPRSGKRRMLTCPRSQFKVTRMLLFVSTVFIVLNVPAYTLRLLAYTWDIDTQWMELQDLQQYALMTFHTNFAINFILYCLCGKKFRRTLWHMVPFRKSQDPTKWVVWVDRISDLDVERRVPRNRLCTGETRNAGTTTDHPRNTEEDSGGKSRKTVPKVKKKDKSSLEVSSTTSSESKGATPKDKGDTSAKDEEETSAKDIASRSSTNNESIKPVPKGKKVVPVAKTANKLRTEISKVKLNLLPIEEIESQSADEKSEHEETPYVNDPRGAIPKHSRALLNVVVEKNSQGAKAQISEMKDENAIINDPRGAIPKQKRTKERTKAKVVKLPYDKTKDTAQLPMIEQTITSDSLRVIPKQTQSEVVVEFPYEKGKNTEKLPEIEETVKRAAIPIQKQVDVVVELPYEEERNTAQLPEISETLRSDPLVAIPKQPQDDVVMELPNVDPEKVTEEIVMKEKSNTEARGELAISASNELDSASVQPATQVTHRWGFGLLKSFYDRFKQNLTCIKQVHGAENEPIRTISKQMVSTNIEDRPQDLNEPVSSFAVTSQPTSRSPNWDFPKSNQRKIHQCRCGWSENTTELSYHESSLSVVYDNPDVVHGCRCACSRPGVTVYSRNATWADLSYETTLRSPVSEIRRRRGLYDYDSQIHRPATERPWFFQRWIFNNKSIYENVTVHSRPNAHRSRSKRK